MARDASARIGRAGRGRRGALCCYADHGAAFALLADSLEPEDRHVEFQGLFNLAFPLAPRTTMAVELWTAQNWDPSGMVRQYSADAAISHLLNNNLQIDFGGNLGLNQATPDVQLYAGVSARF